MADFINNEQQNFGPVGIQSQEVSSTNNDKLEGIKQELEKLNKSTLDIHQLINESRDQIIQALLNNKNVNVEEVQEEKIPTPAEVTDLTDEVIQPEYIDFPNSSNTTFVGEPGTGPADPNSFEFPDETIAKENAAEEQAAEQEVVEEPVGPVEEASATTEETDLGQTIELPEVPGFGETEPAPVEEAPASAPSETAVEPLNPVTVDSIPEGSSEISMEDILAEANNQVTPQVVSDPIIQPVVTPMPTAPVASVEPIVQPQAQVMPVVEPVVAASAPIVAPVEAPASAPIDAPVAPVTAPVEAPVAPATGPAVRIVTTDYAGMNTVNFPGAGAKYTTATEEENKKIANQNNQAKILTNGMQNNM